MTLFRIYALGILCFVYSSLAAQDSITFTLTAHDLDQSTQPALYVYNGIAFAKTIEPYHKSGNDYLFKLKRQVPVMYHLGNPNIGYQYIILGLEDSVKAVARTRSMNGLKLNNTDINPSYNWLKAELDRLHLLTLAHNRVYLQAMHSDNPAQAKQMKARLEEFDKEKLQLLDSIGQIDAYLRSIAALKTWLSYPNHGDGFENESVYLSEKYFQKANFSDPVYNGIPYLYIAFEEYVKLLLDFVDKDEDLMKGIDGQLAKLPNKSMAKLYALKGVVNVFKKKKHPAFIIYAEKMLDNLPNREMGYFLSQEINRFENLQPGRPALDFVQQSPNGDSVRLSDLRGKVVLVDFWASWCGPCRRENPHVLKMYKQYQDKGFEILGVSLDKKADRWTAAIAKDGLTWKHVSDLRGWNNSVAKMYDVSSIPHTVLLDKDGNIHAIGLRGEALEMAVKNLVAPNSID